MIIKQYQTRINFLETNNDLLKNKLNNLRSKGENINFLNMDLNNKIKFESNKNEKKNEN